MSKPSDSPPVGAPQRDDSSARTDQIARHEPSAGEAEDWRPTGSLVVLRRRAELLARLRAFFAMHDILEVETPLLSADTVVDRHLDPFVVPVGGRAERMYLQTSPEFGMKRLLAAGYPSMYQITRAFRQHERGARHNPEFTIVEWYRRDEEMVEGMQFLAALCSELLDVPPAVRLTYAAAFAEHVGLDPHKATLAELRAAAEQHAIGVPDSLRADDRNSWLDLLLVSLVEPHLGRATPTILHDYPASQAALARVRGTAPAVAERFELYVEGVEVANGYHELLDPAALGARAAEQNRARKADGKGILPADSRLLAAMEHGLPAATGAALGFDRLVMLAVGAKDIAEVMAFPIDRA